MWLKIFEFGAEFLAVAFCAIAVKLADDFLDSEYDAVVGRYNWTQTLGRGVMLYAMFFLALAAGMNSKLSLSLFLASYIIGMFHQLHLIFPSRLSGFGESFLAFAAGSLLFGFKMMLFSFCFIVAVQLFDDFFDCQIDKYGGQSNFAGRFGQAECLLVSLIFLFSAGALNNKLIWPVLSGFLIVYIFFSLFARFREVG